MGPDYTFWAVVWVLAATAGTLRALRDSDYRDCLSLVSVGLFSGMVGFGVVAVLVGSSGNHIGHEPYYLGLSALLGLMGKEQDRLMRYVITTVFEKIGVPDLSRPNRVLGDDGPLDDAGGSVDSGSGELREGEDLTEQH